MHQPRWDWSYHFRVIFRFIHLLWVGNRRALDIAIMAAIYGWHAIDNVQHTQQLVIQMYVFRAWQPHIGWQATHERIHRCFFVFSYTMRSVCLWLTVSLRLYMVRFNTDRQTDSDTSGPPADWQSQWQTFNVSHPGQQTDSDTHHNSQCWHQQPDKLNTMYSIEFGWRGGHSMHG